jgi:hypothetical protein
MEVDRDASGFLSNAHGINCADRAFLWLAAIGGEVGKVMGADEMSSSFLKRLQIERVGDVPGTAVFKWRQNGRAPDSVAIDLSFCRQTGVEIIRHISTAKHANTLRQRRIECFNPTVRWQRLTNIGVRALRERVNTCVRSAGPVYAHGPSSDALKGTFQMILDRVAVRLALPASELCAVISGNQFQASRLVGAPRCPESFRESLQRADPTSLFREKAIPSQSELVRHAPRVVVCPNNFAKSFGQPLDRRSRGCAAFSCLRHAALDVLRR